MAVILKLMLYGPLEARESTRLLLENNKNVRRVDVFPQTGSIRVLFSAPISETVLISLFKNSGISGFRIIR